MTSSTALNRVTEQVLRNSEAVVQRTRALDFGGEEGEFETNSGADEEDAGETASGEATPSGSAGQEGGERQGAGATSGAPFPHLPTLEEESMRLGANAELPSAGMWHGAGSGRDLDALKAGWSRAGGGGGGGGGAGATEADRAGSESPDDAEEPHMGPAVGAGLEDSEGELPPAAPPGAEVPVPGGVVRDRVATWEAHIDGLDRQRRRDSAPGLRPERIGERLVDAAHPAADDLAHSHSHEGDRLLHSTSLQRNTSNTTASEASSLSSTSVVRSSSDEAEEPSSPGGPPPAAASPAGAAGGSTSPRRRDWMSGAAVWEPRGDVPDLFPVGAAVATPPSGGRADHVSRAVVCALRPDVETSEARDVLEWFVLQRGLQVTVREATRVHAIIAAPGTGQHSSPDASGALRALCSIGVPPSQAHEPRARSRRRGGSAQPDETDAFWAQHSSRAVGRGGGGGGGEDAPVGPPRPSPRQTSDGFPVAALPTGGGGASAPSAATEGAGAEEAGGKSPRTRPSSSRPRRRRDPLGALAAQRRAAVGKEPSDVDVWLGGGESLVLSRPQRRGGEGDGEGRGSGAAQRGERHDEGAPASAAEASSCERGESPALGVQYPWSQAVAAPVPASAVHGAALASRSAPWLLLVSAAVGVGAREPHPFLVVVTVRAVRLCEGVAPAAH